MYWLETSHFGNAYVNSKATIYQFWLMTTPIIRAKGLLLFSVSENVSLYFFAIVICIHYYFTTAIS